MAFQWRRLRVQAALPAPIHREPQSHERLQLQTLLNGHVVQLPRQAVHVDQNLAVLRHEILNHDGQIHAERNSVQRRAVRSNHEPSSREGQRTVNSDDRPPAGLIQLVRPKHGDGVIREIPSQPELSHRGPNIVVRRLVPLVPIRDQQTPSPRVDRVAGDSGVRGTISLTRSNGVTGLTAG